METAELSQEIKTRDGVKSTVTAYTKKLFKEILNIFLDLLHWTWLGVKICVQYQYVLILQVDYYDSF